MSGVAITDPVTAARAGYLDNLNIGGNVAQDADAKYLLRTAISGQVASSIADIVSTVISRVTAARAGYLDNLNIGGNVAQDMDLKYLMRTTITGQVSNSIADIVNTMISDTKFLFRNAITGQVSNSIADIVNTVQTRLTAARAGYLDNLNIGANVASWSTATRTLTSLNGTISAGSAAKTSIGANTSVTVQPSANHIFDITAAADNLNVTGGLFDGTNAVGGATTTNAVGNLVNVTSYVGTTNSVYLQIKNQDGASAHNYEYTYKSINFS